MAVNEKAIKEVVKKHYSERVKAKEPSSCCGSAPATTCSQGVTSKQSKKEKFAKSIGYTEEDLAALPADAVENAFGCGNPLALTEVNEGDVVLDIGSGAGIDVILASRRVGPGGRVIGLDMIPEMIEKAKANALKAGATNVEFRMGEAEAMPVADNSVDLIISNCVINLSPDKKKVFKEAFRVCKSGGLLMVSDIVTHNLPQALRQNMESWASCIGGAIPEEEYLQAIKEAGFKHVRVVARSDYSGEKVKGWLSGVLDKMDPMLREQIVKELSANARLLSSIKVKGVAIKGCC